jgi:hypothetical protein
MNHRPLLIIASILCAFAILGCDAGREYRELAAANAMHGTDALAQTPEEQVLAEGVKRNIETAADMDRHDLPAPNADVTDPETYAANAQETHKQAEEAGSVWGRVTAWATGGVLLVLGALKAVPGAHRPVVRVLDRILSNKADRQSREAEGLLRELGCGAITALERGEVLPAPISSFANYIRSILPAELVREWCDE